jgi:hypothetical protein
VVTAVCSARVLCHWGKLARDRSMIPRLDRGVNMVEIARRDELGHSMPIKAGPVGRSRLRRRRPAAGTSASAARSSLAFDDSSLRWLEINT